MSTPRDDEALLDYWVVMAAMGTIFVTEAVARALLRAFAQQTKMNESVDDQGNVSCDVYIPPVFHTLTDLFGSETYVRLDQVGLVFHQDDGSRARSKQQELLLRETNPWEDS